LLTFSATRVPNIMKIRQCFLELQLKMSGMFFLRHTVVSPFYITNQTAVMFSQAGATLGMHAGCIRSYAY